MYAITRYEIGDLRGPFYLTTKGGWDTAKIFISTYPTIEEAAKVASQYPNASVVEA